MSSDAWHARHRKYREELSRRIADVFELNQVYTHDEALFTPNGRFVRPGHILVEGAVFYVHPDSWERVSAMLATLPVKK